jgi:hypothetical protein
MNPINFRIFLQKIIAPILMHQKVKIHACPIHAGENSRSIAAQYPRGREVPAAWVGAWV